MTIARDNTDASVEECELGSAFEFFMFAEDLLLRHFLSNARKRRVVPEADWGSLSGPVWESESGHDFSVSQ